MKFNKLFGFLKRNNNGFKFLTNFAKFELGSSRTRVLLNGDIRLKLGQHHISVFPYQKDNNGYLSQYHYTAYFMDQNNNKYELHVYFDQNDQLAMQPVLSTYKSEDDNNRNTKVKITEEFEQSLIQLARDNILIKMAELRQQHLVMANDYANQYVVLKDELEFLSQDLDANFDTYYIKLEKVIAALAELIEIHYDEDYKNLLSLFTKCKNSLAKAQQVEKSKSVEEEKTSEVNPASRLRSSVKTQNKEKPNPKYREELFTKARKAKELFKFVSDQKQKLNIFLNLDEVVNDLINLDERVCPLRHLDLAHIESLISERNNLARELLTALLSARKLDLAISLKKFIQPLLEKFVIEALTRGDAQLLDFLLSNGDFPIDTFLIENVSPVLYCFMRDTKESPKAKCLAVLIKHNASIMTKIEQGFSVANQILQPSHPLYPALIECYDKTLGNPVFFKQLILESKSALIDEKDPADIEKLLADIRLFEINLENAKSLSRTRQSGVIDTLKKVSSKVENEVAMFCKNPVFQEKFILANDLANRATKLLSNNTKNREMVKVNRQLKAMLNVLDGYNKQDEKDCDVNEAIKTVDEFIEIIKLKITLLELSENVKNTKGKKKLKFFKEYQENEIKLKKLEASYDFFEDKEKSQNTASMLKSLDKMHEGTQTLVKGLTAMKKMYEGFSKLAEEFGASHEPEKEEALQNAISKSLKLFDDFLESKEEEEVSQPDVSQFRIGSSRKK